MDLETMQQQRHLAGQKCPAHISRHSAHALCLNACSSRTGFLLMFAMFVVFCGRFVLYNEPVTLSEGGKCHEIKTLKEQKQTGTKTGQEHFLTRLG